MCNSEKCYGCQKEICNAGCKHHEKYEAKILDFKKEKELWFCSGMCVKIWQDENRKEKKVAKKSSKTS